MILNLICFSSVQLLSHIWLFVTPWTIYSTPASLSITNSQSLLRFMSIESVMPYKHLILCRALLVPSIFPLLLKNYILTAWNSLEVISAYFMIKQNFCLEWHLPLDGLVSRITLKRELACEYEVPMYASVLSRSVVSDSLSL